jgi:hypothetical protein
MNFHIGDTGGCWATIAPMDHALHIGLWPLEDRFYPAIAEIANPAVNANAPGLITGIGAKADALYPPADHNASAADCARIAVLHDHALSPMSGSFKD